MRALVVYESMFGNTRQIAQEVERALGTTFEARLLHANSAMPEDLAGVDLVVIGAPTHAWGLPRANTRRAARSRVVTLGDLVLEPGADTRSGVREFLAALRVGDAHGWVAAFDTRRRGPAWLSGRASAAIGSAVSKLGLRELTAPASFLVDRRDHLVPGELERARAWATKLRDEAVQHAAQR